MPGVLDKIVDPNDDPLEASVDPNALPQNGKVEVYPDGSFNYTPNPGFIGIDAFGFFASDGYLTGVDPNNPPGSASGYITLHVVGGGTVQDPFKEAPVLRNDVYNLKLSGDDVPSGELSPDIEGNDGQSPSIDIGTFPFEQAMFPHADSLHQTGGLRLDASLGTNGTNYGINIIYKYVSTYYDGYGPSLVFSLANTEVPVWPSVDIFYVPVAGITDSNIILSGTYAHSNSQGWLTNFATISVDLTIVSPLQSRQSLTLAPNNPGPNSPNFQLAVSDPAASIWAATAGLQQHFGIHAVSGRPDA